MMSEIDPECVNGYRKLKMLGNEPLVESYLVEDMKTSQQYEMKIVSQETFIKYQSQLEFLKTANHPFIQSYITDFPDVSTDTSHCIILEYGCALRSSKPASEQQALAWFAQLCLAQIHSKQCVKAENVVIAGGVAKLCYFDAIISHNGAQEVVHQEDVSELGNVLYEMVSGGKLPYDFEEGKDQEKLPHVEVKQMPAHLSGDCKQLIEKLLEKDPLKRPSIYDVLKIPIIQASIKLITDEKVLGDEKAQRIKQQLLEIDIDYNSKLEEQKEASLSTENTQISSEQFPLALHLNYQQLSQTSVLLPHEYFTERGFHDFLQQIRERGHSKLVDAALFHGLSVSRLNACANINKEVKQLEFEGNTIFKAGGIFYGQCADGVRDGYGLLYCIYIDDGIPTLFECEWAKGSPTKGRRMLIDNEGKWMNYEGQFDEQFLRNGSGMWVDEYGESYIGQFKAGKHHGQGKYSNHEGDTYEGQFKDGQEHGYGILRYSDGATYEGDFFEGQQNGTAKYVWPSGNTYIGQFVDGLSHGQGKHIWASGQIYEGEWKDDKKHGVGKMTWPCGKVYEGQFKDDKINGYGKHTSTNGKIYEGEYFDEQRHGKGKLTLADGESFEGEFKDGLMDGQGIYTWPCGQIQEGMFKNNVANGQCKLVFPDGRTIEGEFKDDIVHGFATDRAADGRVYEGQHEEGERSGFGKYSWPDGREYEGEFKEGKQNGKGKMTFPDGEIWDGLWKDDAMHGKGKKTKYGAMYEGQFEEGQLIGEGKYQDSNGNYEIGLYENGKISGLHKTFTKEGTLLYHKTYLDDEEIKIVEFL
ncbi:hypothetical protein FGO68_gene5789 [Halteria grandinella]|uniref:Protein kinase domain-containing protein n=1 Tax=Halteria grandinella TaxID=5974 RepID=A0A8J8NZX7_HALGN|nr:hypothetical protein FGO68_gene5789 [Halteria grandinella]